jgi:hypothetical protein
MVQKDQNRNEWKMPLELFGSFVRETTIVDSSREDSEIVTATMIHFLYFLYLRIVLWQGFYFLWGLLLSLFFYMESAAAATGDIVMAHPPTSSSFSESPGELDVLMETTTAPSGEPSVNQPTPSSGEPSVNQPTPEINPVEQEVGAQHAFLWEIHAEILQQYQRYIICCSPWMRSDRDFMYGPGIMMNVRTIMEILELELLPVTELEQFLQDIRDNPRQLNSFFQELWGAK